MGIKTSFNRKRQLYLLSKDSNDVNLIKYYKILRRVITEAKRLKYNQIINSRNKVKTIWNIIESEANRPKGQTISNYENSPDTFNDHFLSVAEKIVQSIRHSDTEETSDNKNPTYYLSKISHNPFPNIKFNNTSIKDIERIIKSIKVKNSYGYDGITTKMLKVNAPYISSPLNYICNKSVRSGTL
jgi:hypothetical protein